MTDMNEEYQDHQEVTPENIAILGPSRIGKTSTIASFMRAASEQLQGTSFQFIPRDTSTRQRLNRNNNELNGAIRLGDMSSSTKYNFNEGALAGTSQINNFNLIFQDVDKPDFGLPIDIVDFPGGWLDTVENAGIETVREHLRKSAVLVLPIDSLVLMEANTPKEQMAVLGLLAIEDVKGLVDEWAKARRSQGGTAHLILVPLKCEEYLSPGSREKMVHKVLEARVLNEYAEMLDIAFQTVENLVVDYAPLETIGCLRRVFSEWKFDTPGEAQLNTKFRVVAPRRREVRGAEPLIRAAAGLLEVQLRQQMEQQRSERDAFGQGLALTSAERNRLEEEVAQAGFWDKFFNFFDGHLNHKEHEAAVHAASEVMFEEALREVIESMLNMEQLLNNLAHLPEPDHSISRAITWQEVKNVLRSEDERHA